MFVPKSIDDISTASNEIELSTFLQVWRKSEQPVDMCDAIILISSPGRSVKINFDGSVLVASLLVS